MALCALASAGLAWLRWRLRRRWLRRILEGTDPAWTTDAGSDRDRALPALELLCSWADERTLVQLEASVGPAYRSAERRIRAGRFVPA